MFVDRALITIKAGDAYPNSMLGDIVIELPAGTSAIQLQDLSRFEKADGSIDLDFAEGFDGTIYAVAKWAGVRPAEEVQLKGFCPFSLVGRRWLKAG